MIEGEPIPDHYAVGTTGFEYLAPFPCELGRTRNRRGFGLLFGDSPHQKQAIKLMPNASIDGVTWAVYGDPGEGWKKTSGGVFEIELRTKNFAFAGFMESENEKTLDACLRSIGGIRRRGSAPLSLWEQIKLKLQWYWLRRPVVVSRKII